MDDLNDIKELVAVVLERKKVLSRLRAELRAHVFIAIDEEEVGSGGEGLGLKTVTPQREALLSSSDGKMTVELIHEFLEWCNMEFTMKVFEPEVGESLDYRTHSELRRQLSLPGASDAPVLVTLLQHHQQHGGGGLGGSGGGGGPPVPAPQKAPLPAPAPSLKPLVPLSAPAPPPAPAPAAPAPAHAAPPPAPAAAAAAVPPTAPAPSPAAPTAAPSKPSSPPAPPPQPTSAKAQEPPQLTASASTSLDKMPEPSDSPTGPSPSKLSSLGGLPKLAPLGSKPLSSLPPMLPVTKSMPPPPEPDPLAPRAGPLQEAASEPVPPKQEPSAAASDDTYSMEEEVVSDYSLDAPDDDEDYSLVVAARDKPSESPPKNEPPSSSSTTTAPSAPPAPTPSPAPAPSPTPAAQPPPLPTGRPPLSPLSGLPSLPGMTAAPAASASALATAAAAASGADGTVSPLDLSESNLSSSSVNPGRIRRGKLAALRDLARSSSIEGPSSIQPPVPPLDPFSRDLLAGDRSFGSSRELGGAGGLSFDEDGDPGGLTMSGELPRGGLSGAEMSAEMPRGTAAVAAAAATGGSPEVSPSGAPSQSGLSTSGDLPAPRPRGLAPLAPLGGVKSLAPLGGGGLGGTPSSSLGAMPPGLGASLGAPPLASTRPLKKPQVDDIKDELRRAGLLTLPADSFSMGDSNMGTPQSTATTSAAGTPGTLTASTGHAPWLNMLAAVPESAPSGGGGGSVGPGPSNLRPLSMSRPPPGAGHAALPQQQAPPRGGAGIYDAEMSVNDSSLLEDEGGGGVGAAAAAPHETSAGGASAVLDGPMTGGSGGTPSGTPLHGERAYRTDFALSLEMRDPAISPSDRSGDIENVFGSADFAETADWS